MHSPTQRSEPQILADLVRLLHRREGQLEEMRGVRDRLAPDGAVDNALLIFKSETELIEQARAALHRHVVAEGKAYLSRPRAPINLWTGSCFGVGALVTGIAMLTGFPLPLCLAAGVLALTGAALIIDHKHL